MLGNAGGREACGALQTYARDVDALPAEAVADEGRDGERHDAEERVAAYDQPRDRRAVAALLQQPREKRTREGARYRAEEGVDNHEGEKRLGELPQRRHRLLEQRNVVVGSSVLVVVSHLFIVVLRRCAASARSSSHPQTPLCSACMYARLLYLILCLCRREMAAVSQKTFLSPTDLTAAVCFLSLQSEPDFAADLNFLSSPAPGAPRTSTGVEGEN